MKKALLFFGIIAIIFSIACKKENSNKISLDSQLLGHWKFIGFINVDNDTSLVTLHSDCDSCMSLFISSPNIYFARSYLNGLKTTAYTIDNTLVLKQTMSDGFPEGETESKFFAGIHDPNVWKIKNNHLLLTTAKYSDTLLFISKQ